MNWNTPEIAALVRAALKEDSAHSDVTSRLLLDPQWRVEAVIIAKQSGVIAGLPLAERFWKALNPQVHFRSLITDGTLVKSGRALARLKGPAQVILAGERPALNALQHLSGIATFSHEQVQKLKGTKTRLYDTRKTLPGWRLLQKYAVRRGGAENHRMSLGAEVMIKENHLKVARLAKSDWMNRVAEAMKKKGAALVQIEIQNARDLKEAIRLKPQRVLLDNLSPRVQKQMIMQLRRAIPGIEIELTGGVRPENLRALARLGADRISMGRLTHSVPAFDCSLEITHVYTK